MRLLSRVLLLAAAVSACSTPPTAPVAFTSAPPVTTISGLVVHGELCIEGAAVEVLSGVSAGKKVVQETPCSVYDIGLAGGFMLKDLEPKVLVSLRVTATGYKTLDFTVAPTASAIQIPLTPLG